MKKILSVFLAVVMLVSTLAVGVSAADFKDTNGHWGAEYVDYWTTENAVNGYQDGSFRPDNKVTRGEVAQIIAKILNLLPTSNTNPFKDVAIDDWYYNAILACYDHGIIIGFPDKTARANDAITREQAFVMISRITNVTPNAAAAGLFVDNKQASSWAVGAIGALVGAGVLDGYKTASGTEVRPQNDVTRAEFLKLLATVDKSSNVGYTVGTRKAAETEVPDQPIIIPAIAVSTTTPKPQNFKVIVSVKKDAEEAVEIINTTTADTAVLANLYNHIENGRKSGNDYVAKFGLEASQLGDKIMEAYLSDSAQLTEEFIESLNVNGSSISIDSFTKDGNAAELTSNLITATYKSLGAGTYILTYTVTNGVNSSTYVATMTVTTV